MGPAEVRNHLPDMFRKIPTKHLLDELSGEFPRNGFLDLNEGFYINIGPLC